MPEIASDVAPAPTSLFSRFVGVIVSPKRTFESVTAHPRWLGMLALTTVLIVICTAGPMFTESGRLAALDQQVRSMESFGMTVSDEMYAQMERSSRSLIGAYTTAIFVLVFSPIMALIVAGILWAVFNVALGGEASYKRALAVVVHAGVISTLGQLFTAPLNYLRGSLGSATNLAVLLPMLDDSSFVGRLMGMIDFFMVWYVIVLAIGLAVLYRRRTQPIAIGLFAVYAVIAVALAAVLSRLGGSN